MGDDATPDIEAILPGFAETRREAADRKRRGEVGPFEVAAMHLRRGDSSAKAREAREVLGGVLRGADFPPEVADALSALNEACPQATAETMPWRAALVAACSAIQGLTTGAVELEGALDDALEGWASAIRIASEAGANRDAIAEAESALKRERNSRSAKLPRNATGRFVLAAFTDNPDRTGAQFMRWVDALIGRGGVWGSFDVEREPSGKITITDDRGSETVNRGSVGRRWRDLVAARKRT